jgi:hypothetical protein
MKRPRQRLPLRRHEQPAEPPTTTPLLRKTHLKYHNSISDAVADLGKPEEISKVFVGFQKFLYQEGARVCPALLQPLLHQSFSDH